MFEYSAEKVISRWNNEGMLFVGDKKRMRRRVLDILLRGVKELVASILNDGFPINGVFEILHHEKLIPEFVTLPMFYRWRSRNVVFKQYKGFIAAVNPLSPYNLKHQVTEVRHTAGKNSLSTALLGSLPPAASNPPLNMPNASEKTGAQERHQTEVKEGTGKAHLLTSAEEPWRIVPTGELLPLKADDPRNPWKDGAGFNKQKINWLTYDSVTGVIFDPKVMLPVIKEFNYVPCSIPSMYFNPDNRSIGERRSINIEIAFKEHFRQTNEVWDINAFYVIEV